MPTQERIDRDIKQLISENGLRSVIGALARYCRAPSVQVYPVKVMATTSRRLNLVCDYLVGKEERNT